MWFHLYHVFARVSLGDRAFPGASEERIDPEQIPGNLWHNGNVISWFLHHCIYTCQTHQIVHLKKKSLLPFSTYVPINTTLTKQKVCGDGAVSLLDQERELTLKVTTYCIWWTGKKHWAAVCYVQNINSLLVQSGESDFLPREPVLSEAWVNYV